MGFHLESSALVIVSSLAHTSEVNGKSAAQNLKPTPVETKILWPKILWVDDDIEILDTAERLLRGQPWTFVSTASVAEARELLKKIKFAVVVADQRMQESTGNDLLSFAKRHSPQTTRILLTGRVEYDVIEQA